MSRGPAPCLAAVTLDARGGGVALVARLLREVLRRHWGEGASVSTLMPDVGGANGLHPGLTARLRFGADLAWRQATGRCEWVLHAHPSLARVQRFVPARFRQPYVVFVHGIEAWRRLSPAERDLYRHAEVCLTNSRYTAAEVARANPELPALVPCPLALVPGEAPTAETWAGTPLGPHAVVIVGRMSAGERYKGHDALIDAWRQVRTAVPDAVLVCAGDGDDVPRLQARAAALGDGAVRFTGFLPAGQLHALYDEAAVFAMPSRGEGFGLVYLEAMAHGLPCVGSVHDAAREIIDDGVTGYLVDQADPAMIAGRLVGLLRDDGLRRTMGASGRARLASSFAFDAFAGRVIAALAERPSLVPRSVPAARTA